MMYTVTVYKDDRRYATGQRFKGRFDIEAEDQNAAIVQARALGLGHDLNYIVVETYVTRRNLITGKEYQERYDTPHYCSPSSETYWSM